MLLKEDKVEKATRTLEDHFQPGVPVSLSCT